MRNIYLSLLCACAICGASCSPKCKIVWTEGETDPQTGKASYVLEIQNPPRESGWTVWFAQFHTPMTFEEGTPGEIVHINGTIHRIVPTAYDKDGGNMVLRYQARPLITQSRAPEGFILETRDGKKTLLETTYNFLPQEPIHSFEYTPTSLSAYDMIPELKEVNQMEGTINPTTAKEEEVTFVSGKTPGWYRITLGNTIAVEAADEDGAWYAGLTLENIRRNSKGGEIPCAVVSDWPDLPYRGLMMDVSRNFVKKDDLLKLMDLMSHYKANYLHLHFGDDEGWRVEIDALPELTSYGAFRGVPTISEDGTLLEPEALELAYCGSVDRNDAASPGNGYYSHQDFVEILRHAADLHIKVIPEFDTPGHSRAAIKSMEIRAQRTGDTSCLLSEKEDRSSYVSVQDYKDNVINVALPSTYTFIETVFDAIIALYEEAGVPLEAIHVGGDEVPGGAWEGSPACQALMRENGRTDIHWLKEYFISRVLDIAEARGVKIAGWQEVIQSNDEALFERLKENLFFVNFWTVSGKTEEIGYKLANAGVPVLLSNAPNFYFDLSYNDSKLERGHSWAGFVDERRSYSFLPFNLYRSVRWDDHRIIKDIADADKNKTPLLPEARANIIGVQGQLWSETIRNFDHVTYYLFPKSLGLFERGWNAHPAWEGTTVSDDPAFTAAFDRFFSIIHDYEYPWFEENGISYHVN